jgi:hypothetical protein
LNSVYAYHRTGELPDGMKAIISENYGVHADQLNAKAMESHLRTFRRLAGRSKPSTRFIFGATSEGTDRIYFMNRNVKFSVLKAFKLDSFEQVRDNN